MDSSRRDNSHTRVHFKILGHPFGVYTWSRSQWRVGGVVVRLGPLGHVQAQHYRCQLVGKHAEGRRGKHGVKLSCWGVRGRRHKRAVEFAVYL